MSLVRALRNKIILLNQISLWSYIKYNFLSKHIIRDKSVHIIPYKNAKIEFAKGAKLYIKGSDLLVGINKIKGSKAETYIRMKENAVWRCNNGGRLTYGATVEVHEKALLETGFFQTNTATVIICTKHITIGDDVWMGRNIVVYDSDYHQIQDKNGNNLNLTKPVNIGDHVWLTNHVMVMKGVTIGKGSVVAPYTVVRKDVAEKSFMVNAMQPKTVNDDVYWSSKRVPDWGYDGD